MKSDIVFKERASNIAKTWMLMTVILVGSIILGFFASQYFGSPTILYGFILMSLVFNFFGYWFSDSIALRMNHAKEVTAESHPQLIAQVARLASRANLPMPRVYVIDDPSANAFATGRNPSHAAVAVTTGIMNTLSTAELDGVIAHELAHIGNRDILLSTVVVVLVGAFSIVADFVSRGFLFGGEREEGNSSIWTTVIALVVSLIIPFVGVIIQLAISRRREFLADATGASITGEPRQLAFALQKISAQHQPMHDVHQSTAHLFFANPVGADAEEGKDNQVATRGGVFARMFSTHPPIAERVAKLESMTG